MKGRGAARACSGVRGGPGPQEERDDFDVPCSRRVVQRRVPGTIPRIAQGLIPSKHRAHADGLAVESSVPNAPLPFQFTQGLRRRLRGRGSRAAAIDRV